MARSPEMMRVLRARENVALKDRWFADVIYNIGIIETEQTKTFDTNGVVIRFNPKFVKEWAKDGTKIEGIFCHEGWHVILDHIRRRGTREGKLWNIACDAIINPMVRNRGWPLPTPHVRIREVEDKRMSAEKAYEWLRQKQDEVGGGDGGDDDCMEPGSEEMQIDAETVAEIEKVRHKLERAIESATARAIAGGYMDNEVRKQIVPEEMVRRILWREALRDMIENHRNNETRTWSRPNRRYIGQGILRPGYLRDKINRIVMLFDCSGSIEENSLKEMKAEGYQLLSEGIVDGIHLISVDTSIRARGEASYPDQVIDFELRHRGGGTNFHSAMTEVGKLKDCVGAIFLTDMMSLNFGPDPGIPVVWINWGSNVYPGHQYYPPYGRVIKYERSIRHG